LARRGSATAEWLKPAFPRPSVSETLRRSIQALAEGRDPGDLTTIEDPGALEQIRRALL
jgi:propionyl-CoA synthetase